MGKIFRSWFFTLPGGDILTCGVDLLRDLDLVYLRCDVVAPPGKFTLVECPKIIRLLLSSHRRL